jgi:hypothetical protein
MYFNHIIRIEKGKADNLSKFTTRGVIVVCSHRSTFLLLARVITGNVSFNTVRATRVLVHIGLVITRPFSTVQLLSTRECMIF